MNSSCLFEKESISKLKRCNSSIKKFMTGLRAFVLPVSLVVLASVVALLLSACGGGGGSRSQPVTQPGDEMTITPPGTNSAPVIEQTFEDITLTLDSQTTQWESGALTAYFSDPDSDSLEFEAEVESINVRVVDVTFERTGSHQPVSLILRAVNTGTATVTITAADPAGLTAAQNFTVTVNDGTVSGPDHADTPQGATVIASGETVEGSIDSPDDVDYFRLELTEPGTVIATITAEPGVEIAIVDANGNVLATAVTASDATAGVTINKGVLYLKVLYKLLEEGKKVSYKFVAKVIDNLETAINVVRKIPNYTINVGAVGVSIDLREYFEAPQGSLPIYKATASLGVLNLKVEGSTLDISALQSASPGDVIRVTATAELDSLEGLPPPPIVGLPLAILRAIKAVDIFTVTIGGQPPRQIEGTDLSVSVEQGGEVMLRLTDYIEDPEGGAITFAHGSLPAGFGVTTDGANWTISVPADAALGEHNVTVTATDENNISKDFHLRVTVIQELGTEFLQARNVDCYIHRDNQLLFGAPIAYFAFSGGCLERKAHGQGTATIYFHNSSASQRYAGGWRDGKMHGRGTATFYSTTYGSSASNDYVGGWRDGKRHGQGIWTRYERDGAVSKRDEGEWRDGILWNGTKTSYSFFTGEILVITRICNGSICGYG